MKSALSWFVIAACISISACDTNKGSPGGDTGVLDAVDAMTLDVPEVLSDGKTDQGGDVVTDTIVDQGEDTTGPKAYVSARVTSVPLDMVEGDNAYGIRGKSYVIENDMVRFVIQDKGVAVHLDVYGGNMIDADLRREIGTDGNDQFREFIPLVGFRVNGATKVEVVKDGSDGEEALIRVTGKDTKMGILEMIDGLADELGVTIRTDYILEPDVRWLKVRTEVENPKSTPIQGLPVGDFVAFGGASHVFKTGGGFTGDPLEVTALVSSGRGASYGYTLASGTVTVPYQELNAAITVLGFDFKVPAKGKASYDRYFVVGDGDIASVLDIVHELRGDATEELSGLVTDEAGDPIKGAKVTVFHEGEGDPSGDGHALTQAFTGSNGRYELMLEAGEYDVVCSVEGRLRDMKGGVDITQFDADFQMGAAGRVGLDIEEHDGERGTLGHIPAKVSLYCLEGGEAPWKELGESERHGLCDVLFTADGQGEHPVRPGHYKAVISRGIEYETAGVEDLEVLPGKTVWIEEELLRSVDTTGFMSGDLHQHTLGSIDAETTHVEKVIENLAEGVEIAAVTDHDNITSYGPAITVLGVWDLIASLDGDEVSVQGKGHFNIFEPEGDDETLYPFIGAKLYMDKAFPVLIEDLRAIPGVEVVQMNHPRTGFDAYLSWIHFDPVTGTSLFAGEVMAWDFDSIEVKGSLGEPGLFTIDSDPDIQKQAKWGSQDIPVMRDWFSFLNMGMDTCAMGNSDAHNRNDGVGYSRTFFRLGFDSPSDVSTGDVLDAVKDQKAMVSNGPFIRIMVEDPQGPGLVERIGHTELVGADEGAIKVDLTITAASWIDVSRLEVYGNGRPLHLKEVVGVLLEDEKAEDTDPLWVPIPLPNTTYDEVERLHTTVELFPDGDTWYVFVVKGEGNLAPVGNGAPFAYTNPLYVDVDGDGKFAF